MKKIKGLTVLLLVFAMIVSLVTGCGNNEAAPEADATEAPAAEEATETEEPAEESGEEAAQEAAVEDILAPDGYHLVWHDEFDGDKLNEDDWNREKHSIGWVNHERQEYVTDEEFAFVENGELVIWPKEVILESGNPIIRSGRINTQNKHDIKYGRIEARLKVPEGKGFLPAFWMMPQDEDIMEVLGDQTNVNYGTLHFGEPHKQNQGSIQLPEGDYAHEYHNFAIEWDPGEIRWYMDDQQYFQTSDWFTAVQGEEEKPYPAPFNQPFHVILNVAVGGDWPGDPDETTVYDERSQMRVDYVRMFQKDEYDENVTRPVNVLSFKEPDENGNYVTNGDFSEREDLSDDEGWKFLLLKGGDGAADILDGELTVATKEAGNEAYAVQLVQPGMPMKKGTTYTYSFEAYADSPRTMKTAITAPNVDWIRYLEDTEVKLGKKWKKYSFTFKMKDEDDDAGRVEFNMGHTDSTATIHIRNVVLKEK